MTRQRRDTYRNCTYTYSQSQDERYRRGRGQQVVF